MLKRSLAATAAMAMPFAFAAGAGAQEAGMQTATVELTQLNDSGASGTAELMFDDSTNMLTVNIDTSGMVANLPHAQHIHIGGQNVCPDMSAAGEDSILSTPEGQPSYGEIQISLTTEGDFGPSSALAVERFPVASDDGEVSYTRTFDLTETMGDLTLDDVVIVQHGIDTISPNGEYGPPPPTSPLDPALPLEATAPATCGAVMGMSTGQPTPAPTDTTQPPADDQTSTQDDQQVSAMPSGGVSTGGGATAGLEHEGLIALGALGLLAAGALAVRPALAARKR